jgi:hypothetical protein
MVWKEVVTVNFQVLSPHMLGETKENLEKDESE